LAMPLLFYMKYRTGKSMGSRSLVADSKQTLACMFLSLALLVGLGLNYLWGLWWADPAVGLLVVVYLFREGRGALKEEKLCTCCSCPTE
jgi:divalent metal cation (Fe/Co/Zn/Cd) transporter